MAGRWGCVRCLRVFDARSAAVHYQHTRHYLQRVCPCQGHFAGFVRVAGFPLLFAVGGERPGEDLGVTVKDV
jgi:hypothetical protein